MLSAHDTSEGPGSPLTATKQWTSVITTAAAATAEQVELDQGVACQLPCIACCLQQPAHCLQTNSGFETREIIEI